MNTFGPVLVTGATGFLGSHVVRRLVRDGREVHGFARPASSFARLPDVVNQVAWWTGDITDVDAITHACRESRIELIVHCAGDTSARRFNGDWSTVERALLVNLQGTLAVLRGAAESRSAVRAVVRIGGLEEYGTAPTPWSEEMREEPSSPYSASQVAATHACQALQRHLSFAVTTLRPALIYGPGQSTDFLIPDLITTLLRAERFAMTDGRQHRDLIYIDDVAEAVMCALQHPELRGGLFNISSGHEWNVAEIARRIAILCGGESLLDLGARPAREGELLHLVAANDRAANRLGWQATVDLEEGLQRTVAWYRESSELAGPR